MRRKRILIVTFTGGTGGIAVLLRNILERLKGDARFTFEICFTQDLGVIADEIEKLGIKVHFIGMKNGFDLFSATKLIKLLQNGRYDLVNFHGQLPVVRLMFALAGVKLILGEHGGIKEEAQRGRKINPWLHRILDTWTSSYITVSDDSINDLVNVHKVNQKKIVKIYNGISLSYFDPSKYHKNEIRNELDIPNDCVVFGTVRALTSKMGIDDFLYAANIVGSKYPNTCFVIVGDGPLRRELENIAQKTQVDSKIIFTGVRRDVPRILSGFDVFVLPSLWEALPIAAIESLAMGVPVISYDVGGVNEIVVNGETGFVVKERNFRLLAQSMEMLYSDPILRLTLGQKGIKRTQELFDIEQCALKYANYFEYQCSV